MVGHQTLDLVIMVRVHVPEPGLRPEPIGSGLRPVNAEFLFVFEYKFC